MIYCDVKWNDEKPREENWNYAVTEKRKVTSQSAKYFKSGIVSGIKKSVRLWGLKFIHFGCSQLGVGDGEKSYSPKFIASLNALEKVGGVPPFPRIPAYVCSTSNSQILNFQFILHLSHSLVKLLFMLEVSFSGHCLLKLYEKYLCVNNMYTVELLSMMDFVFKAVVCGEGDSLSPWDFQTVSFWSIIYSVIFKMDTTLFFTVIKPYGALAQGHRQKWIMKERIIEQDTGSYILLW